LTSAGAAAQIASSAFTYQGELRSGSAPVEGVFDLRFSLFEDAGGQTAVASELCADNVQVSGGRFTVLLDFGSVFSLGRPRFLEVRVRPDTGTGCGDASGFEVLTPRQPLTATPHASFALTSGSATMLNGQAAAFYTNAANLTGTLADTRLSSNVGLRSATQTFTGANTFSSAANSFAGIGTGLTALSASNIALGTIGDARLSPNVPLKSAANGYTGANTFSNASNSFTGSGSGLTSLNASALTTGVVAETRLPALGGDIAGPYGSLGVLKLRGIPVAPTAPLIGQVLKYDGTQWTPGADLNAITTAGPGLSLVGPALGVASDGITGVMLASDDTAIEKVTERFIRWNTNRTGVHLGPPGYSTSLTPGVLQIIGGEPDVPILQVVGFDGSGISLRAGQATSPATVGGSVSIVSGNGFVLHNGGLAEFGSGAGGNSPLSGGNAGDGGICRIKAGDGGDGRTSISGDGGHAVIRAGDSPAADSGIRGLGGNVYLIPGLGSNASGVGINLAEGATLNANLRIRGNGVLGRVVLESGGADQATELLFSENNSNTNGIYLRGDGVTNALKVIDLTAGGETVIASFDRDTNGFAAGIKAFKIDHPLDPLNKVLYHSCVESPDMMNIYNGTTVTDATGYATIQLPAYFNALNRDFRYQLTVIDEADSDNDFVLVKVVRKIGSEAPNQFTVRSSRGGVEVSWQVTGVRQDALAETHRIVPEVEKGPSDKGRLLNPDAFVNTPPVVVR
jgi:hypothetical protein